MAKELEDGAGVTELEEHINTLNQQLRPATSPSIEVDGTIGPMRLEVKLDTVVALTERAVRAEAEVERLRAAIEKHADFVDTLAEPYRRISQSLRALATQTEGGK
jgi:hypothetical protein